MEIYLNGKPADITLDSEETLGDVLSGIDQWISQTGNRIAAVNVDGINVAVEALDIVFSKEIKTVKKLEIVMSSFRELAMEALEELVGICALFTDASFEERSAITESWEKSPAARFLASDIPDTHALSANCFSGNGLSANDLAIILEERLREIADPERETANSEAIVKSIVKRMEELPLDMQTGKDQRAAETIQLFSKVGEKLFRMLSIYKAEGLSLDTFSIEDLPARAFIDDLNSALDEISRAYKDQDTVLAGDIAEYELAPRLLKFFNALRELKISSARVLTSP